MSAEQKIRTERLDCVLDSVQLVNHREFSENLVVGGHHHHHHPTSSFYYDGIYNFLHSGYFGYTARTQKGRRRKER